MPCESDRSQESWPGQEDDPVTMKGETSVSDQSLCVQPSARQSTPSKPSTSYSTCKSSPHSTTCQSTPAHTPATQPTKVTASLQSEAGFEAMHVSRHVSVAVSDPL